MKFAKLSRKIKKCDILVLSAKFQEKKQILLENLVKHQIVKKKLFLLKPVFKVNFEKKNIFFLDNLMKFANVSRKIKKCVILILSDNFQGKTDSSCQFSETPNCQQKKLLFLLKLAFRANFEKKTFFLDKLMKFANLSRKNKKNVLFLF